jgi:predicted ATP-grasp superfamily ATP-dependent carboligase
MTALLDEAPAKAVRKAPPRHPDALPPAIVVGGGANALSVARQLGRMGVKVYGLCEPGAFVRHSRFCTAIPVEDGGAAGGVVGGDGGLARAWAAFLLGEQSNSLRGAVLLACSDAGIRLVAENREALSERFLLDESNPAAQLAMLNKLSTYRAAAAAGVPTPRFWVAESARDLEAVRGELVFPLVVKPRLGYVFEAKTGKKLIQVENFEQVAAAVDAVAATGTASVLMEKIPGPDERLCSYYTYLDKDSRPLLHFTKRVIRRYPVMTGTACYHVTDWIPEAVELGNQLFAHVGLRGLANVEFKRDERDGKLKLIECNARFTAADCLVARSGIRLAEFVYCRVTGRPTPAVDDYVKGMRLWDPVRDFQAHRAMKRAGTITTRQWIAGVCRRQTFPYFRWSDPMPAVARATLPIRKALGWARK